MTLCNATVYKGDTFYAISKDVDVRLGRAAAHMVTNKSKTAPVNISDCALSTWSNTHEG